jgi:addiction module HigA family antidote
VVVVEVTFSIQPYTTFEYSSETHSTYRLLIITDRDKSWHGNRRIRFILARSCSASSWNPKESRKRRSLRLGWTKARLNELVRGKRGVTAMAALDLAETLGTSPKLWMNLQATYDLDRAARERQVA